MISKKTIVILLFMTLSIYVGFSLYSNNSSELANVNLEEEILTEGWELYTNDLYNYRLSYPMEYQIEENGQYSNIFTHEDESLGSPTTNFVYISVIPKDQDLPDGSIYNYSKSDYDKLSSLNVGDSVALSDIEQESYFTYKRAEDRVVNENIAKVFYNTLPWSFPNGTTETRYYFDTEKYLYLLGIYNNETKDSIDNELINQIINSFNIIN